MSRAKALLLFFALTIFGEKGDSPIVSCNKGTVPLFPREFYAAPDGNPKGDGTKERPWDLETALSHPPAVKPGDTIWLRGGSYGENAQATIRCLLSGTPERPIIVRQSPGERATVRTEIEVEGSHVWLWGFELTGTIRHGVTIRSGDGIKLINLIIQDLVVPGTEHLYGIAGWDVGDDHEFYGNIIYRVGTTSADHAIYAQNTAGHALKKLHDNIVFENAGFGIHIWGESPVLSGFHVEGNICFATSLMPRDPQTGQVNILIGGQKPLSNVVLKNNCTYHPQEGSKRGVDIGYTGAPNRDILVEDNYFMCGGNALELKGIADATVRNNTFWAANGMVHVAFASQETLQAATDAAPAKPGEPKVLFENNTYIDNGKFNLAAFQAAIRSGKTDRVVQGANGRPTGLHVFKRVNQYEAERVHLAVYNWDHKDIVRIDLDGLLNVGDAYRVVNVLDFFGKPVVEGKAEGSFINLPMKGHRYEPEFGAYILFRDVRKY